MHHVCAGACGGQKKEVDTVELELHAVMSHHVRAGN